MASAGSPISALLGVLVVVASIVVAGVLLGWALWLVTGYDHLKLLSRSLLVITALVLLVAWWRSGLIHAQLGPSLRDGLRAARTAFWWGCVSVLPPVLVFFVVGFRVLDDRVVILDWAFLGLGLWILLTAALVGLFEECLFRGYLTTALHRYVSYAAAAVVTSALYSLVHFLEAAPTALQQVEWYTGFVRFGDAFAGLSDALSDWSSALALFLLGLLLAYVRRLHGLWSCIGLHAAWVVCDQDPERGYRARCREPVHRAGGSIRQLCWASCQRLDSFSGGSAVSCIAPVAARAVRRPGSGRVQMKNATPQRAVTWAANAHNGADSNSASTNTRTRLSVA